MEIKKLPQKNITPLNNPSGRKVAFPAVISFTSAIVIALIFLFSEAVMSESSTPFRIGFSRSNFFDVNENDAIAAVRVWSQKIASTRGITADPQPKIYQNAGEIEKALLNKAIDCISITTEEYAELKHLLDRDTLVVASASGSISEEYLLLVSTESGFTRLEDLRGASLGLIDSWGTNLASPWLDIALYEKGLGLAQNFFSRINSFSKTEKGILSVFFGKIDACLINRKGFETMCELNPQIDARLKPLAVSPPLIKGAFFFRRDYSSPLKNRIMSEITTWHMFPESRQILTIFKTDRLESHPVRILDSSLELLETHRKIMKKNQKNFSEDTVQTNPKKE